MKKIPSHVVSQLKILGFGLNENARKNASKFSIVME